MLSDSFLQNIDNCSVAFSLLLSIVDRLLTLFCMIPKVNLGFGEMGFMFVIYKFI